MDPITYKLGFGIKEHKPVAKLTAKADSVIESGGMTINFNTGVITMNLTDDSTSQVESVKLEAAKRLQEALDLKNGAKKWRPASYTSGGTILVDQLDGEMVIPLNMGDESPKKPEPEPTDLSAYEENDDFGAF